MIYQLLCIPVGIWLMATPSILGVTDAERFNDHILGPLVVAIAVLAAWESTRSMRKGNVALGCWLLASPWLLPGTTWVSTLNDSACGLLLVGLGASSGWIQGKFGGGWSSLWGAGDPWLEFRAGDDQPQAPFPQVVVITGASAGVGRATVRAFAGPGVKIGLIARGRAGLEAARKEVEEAGGEALVLPTDTANADAVEAAASAVEEKLGPIDVWVNDAMLSVFSTVKEMTAEDYRRVTEVTYLGYVHGTLSALKRMLPRDRGVIVQVGSALAYRGIPLQSAYCACKHAVQGFNDSLRAELIHESSRVRVASVEMPALNTPQFGWVKSRLPHQGQPVPPIFQPEVAAEAIHYAALHRRREILVGYPTIKAVWGNKFFPNFADHFLGRSGFKSQQTDQPRDPDRPNNLHHPLDDERDHGARGAFSDRARPSSKALWLDLHRDQVTLATSVSLALICWLALAWIKFGA